MSFWPFQKQPARQTQSVLLAKCFCIAKSPCAQLFFNEWKEMLRQAALTRHVILTIEKQLPRHNE